MRKLYFLEVLWRELHACEKKTLINHLKGRQDSQSLFQIRAREDRSGSWTDNLSFRTDPDKI